MHPRQVGMDETGSLGKNDRTDQKGSALFNVATALRILGDSSITSMQKSTPDLSSNGCPDSSNKVKSSAPDGPQGTKQGRNQKGGVSGGRLKKVTSPSRCGNHNDDVPMTFPQKLNEILEDKANENIITWLPHGKAFIIYYKKRFAAEIMPRYFKESKYTSFTRKLNRWGFTRVSRGPESGAYYHKCFQKGNHLLRMQMFCQSGTKPKEEQEVPQPQHSLAEIRNTTSSHRHSQVSSPIAACTPGGMLPTPPPPSMATSMATAGAGAVVPQSHSIPTPSHATVDLVSQHMRLLEMTRSRQLRTGGAPTAANSAAFANTQTLPNENFSSAVINAAVEALQRSNEASKSGGAECGLMKMAPKPMPMLSGSTFQQQIDQYKKHGIMDPSMMQAIVRQQAAAEVMARAQRDRVAASSARLEQLQKSRKSYSKSAHAA